MGGRNIVNVQQQKALQRAQERRRELEGENKHTRALLEQAREHVKKTQEAAAQTEARAYEEEVKLQARITNLTNLLKTLSEKLGHLQQRNEEIERRNVQLEFERQQQQQGRDALPQEFGKCIELIQSLDQQKKAKHDAVEKEDYESAQQCKDAITELHDTLRVKMAEALRCVTGGAAAKAPETPPSCESATTQAAEHGAALEVQELRRQLMHVTEGFGYESWCEVQRRRQSDCHDATARQPE